jgi:hypothetical protein
MLWLASYPRSGSTWVQFIIAGLLYKTDNALEISRLIPDCHKPDIRDGTYKTHLLVPPAGKKIYVVRHPVDVCISGTNYKRLKRGRVKVHKYVRHFVRYQGNPDWIQAGFGSWVEHVKSWHNTKNCLFIKYEELLKNTRHEIERIAGFLEVANPHTQHIVETTSFKAMRNAEKLAMKKGKRSVLYNPKHKGYSKGSRFINIGKAGYAKVKLSQEEINSICEACKGGMDLMGYRGYESIC